MLLHLAAMVYFIASDSPTDQGNVPLTPVGAQFVASGMILVGVAALRAKVWRGWQDFTPFVVRLYSYMVPFVGLIVWARATASHFRGVVGRGLDTARLCRLFKRD